MVVKASLNPQYRKKMEFDLRPALAAKAGASLILFRVYRSSPHHNPYSILPSKIYMLGFGYAAAKECLLCPFDSYEAVGMDSFMGYAELDLAKVKLPYRGNLDLFSGTHTCSPCEHQTVVLY